MSKFLVSYLAPGSVTDDWKRTPAEAEGGGGEDAAGWKKWMADHTQLFADKGAGVGKTKRIMADGTDTRNDVMLYSIVEAESHEAAARSSERHPHFGIPQASIEIMELHPLPGVQGN